MNRPRILVNVAATVDGKIDSFLRQGTSISSLADKARVDRMRADVDAIIVGGHTLLAEDPKLTIKSEELRAERLLKGLSENPAKIGIVTMIPSTQEDLALSTDKDGASYPGRKEFLQNFLSSGPAQIYIFTTSKTPNDVREKLRAVGAIVHTDNLERVDLRNLFQFLVTHGIRSVLVEGGGTLIAELLKLGLVDEITLYIAPKILGGGSSPTLADSVGFPPEEASILHLLSFEKIDDEGGILLRYAVKNTDGLEDKEHGSFTIENKETA